MKQKFQIILLLFLVAFSLISVTAQDDKFITEVIQSLDATNPLRLHLQRGDRGDGIHREWMDEMKMLNIRQASFYMNFEWKDYQIKAIAVKGISYYPDYYSFDDTEIKAPKLLQQIKEFGLEKKLETAALDFAKSKLMNIMKSQKLNSVCGVTTQNLLDDERLPRISLSPTEFDKTECPK